MKQHCPVHYGQLVLVIEHALAFDPGDELLGSASLHMYVSILFLLWNRGSMRRKIFWMAILAVVGVVDVR
jgi:hypothetical protein